MRKSYLLLTGAAVLLAACSGDKKTSINSDLQKDLELASSSDGITLANASPNAAQQVVSAIERTSPAPKQKAPSTTVRRHKPAPKATPHVAQTTTRATVSEIEEQTVAEAPVADDPMPVSPRPQPVAVSYPSGASSGGDDGRVGGGSSTGVVLGTILGAVIRGGVGGDIDRCDPRVDGRRGGILINNRIPLPGRVGGRVTSGGITNSRPPLGRIR